MATEMVQGQPEPLQCIPCNTIFPRDSPKQTHLRIPAEFLKFNPHVVVPGRVREGLLSPRGKKKTAVHVTLTLIYKYAATSRAAVHSGVGTPRGRLGRCVQYELKFITLNIQSRRNGGEKKNKWSRQYEYSNT